MKTKVTIILFFFFLVSGCLSSNPEKKKNDLKEMKLYGNVKSLRKYTNSVVKKFGEFTKGERTRTVRWGDWDANSYIIFNDKGNIVEENWYNPGDFFNLKRTYKYNDKGNVIKRNQYNSDSDGSLDYRNTYKYNDKGNKIECNVYYLKSSGTYITNTHSEGNKIEYNGYNPNGSLNSKTKYKYDDKGNIVEYNRYNSDGSLDIRYIDKYDDKGNIIEENRYNSDGSLDYKYTYKYEYDEKYNWIKKIYYKDGIPKFISEREIEYYN